MYEHLRNDFLSALVENGIPENEIHHILLTLDQVSARYEIQQKELSLTVYDDGLPELVKNYIVCKKIEGLTDNTLETYLRTLRIFFEELRKPPEQISANDIRIFLFKYQQQRHCSNRSLDKYRGYLSGFFTWATDEGYLSSNPMKTVPSIKYERKSRQNLTQLELEYLREACETLRERAIIEFLYSTGCRVYELCIVKSFDIDWNTKSVHLFGKGRKHRTSFINAKAEVALQTYLESRTDSCEYLFVTERKPTRKLTSNAVEKIVRAISSRVSDKISKPITPHVLRHTTATTALQSGMPIEDISKLLGHESIDTTMIYAHTSLESVQAGHRKYIV